MDRFRRCTCEGCLYTEECVVSLCQHEAIIGSLAILSSLPDIPYFGEIESEIFDLVGELLTSRHVLCTYNSAYQLLTKPQYKTSLFTPHDSLKTTSPTMLI